jgi:hypothetical protein
VTITNFLKKYNLHDSLLEKIDVYPEQQTLVLTVDYCYWQQNEYRDGEAETGIVIITFSGVKEFFCDDHEINSDEIIACTDDGDDRLMIQVASDITGNVHTLIVSAEDVGMTEQKLGK